MATDAVFPSWKSLDVLLLVVESKHVLMAKLFLFIIICLNKIPMLVGCWPFLAQKVTEDKRYEQPQSPYIKGVT